jgi:hypothetical protein
LLPDGIQMILPDLCYESLSHIVVLCRAVSRCAMLCRAVPRCVVRCCATLCHTVPCRALGCIGLHWIDPCDAGRSFRTWMASLPVLGWCQVQISRSRGRETRHMMVHQRMMMSKRARRRHWRHSSSHRVPPPPPLEEEEDDEEEVVVRSCNGAGQSGLRVRSYIKLTGA